MLCGLLGGLYQHGLAIPWRIYVTVLSMTLNGSSVPATILRVDAYEYLEAVMSKYIWRLGVHILSTAAAVPGINNESCQFE